MSVIISDKFFKQKQKFQLKLQEKISETVMQIMADVSSRNLNVHKCDHNNWWSVYVNGDVRIILHRDGEKTHVCWVDHHEAAYQWTERNKFVYHPHAKEFQIVEIPSIVETFNNEHNNSQIEYVSLFSKFGFSRDYVYSLGIPELWLDKVLNAKTEDEILEIVSHLPTDVQEILLRLSIGEYLEIPSNNALNDENVKPTLNTSQSWMIVSSEEELNLVLRDNWEAWVSFLHPKQKEIAYKTYNGFYRVGGSAGTGKTVVLLHHAKHIIEQDITANVLVTTYSDNLATDLNFRNSLLLSPRQLERCTTQAFYDFGQDCFKKIFCKNSQVPIFYNELQMKDFVVNIAKTVELPAKIYPEFVASEWIKIIDARNIQTWDEYKTTPRRKVKIRLSEERRRALWFVFEKVRKNLNAQNVLSHGEMFGRLAEWFENNENHRLYDYILVDESQDLSEIEIRFLAAYNKKGNGLFFAGDIGQRVCRYQFPWSKYGIDLRGKSKTLKINYRTTKEIRSFADKLVNLNQVDADDNPHDRRGTISILNGPEPQIIEFNSCQEEILGVANWLDQLYENKDINKVMPNNIAIFTRSKNELSRAIEAYEKSKYYINRENNVLCPKITTMEEAKGLEYKAVIVMCCDSDVIPSQERLAEQDIVASLEEIYDTERNLFYVACTRARDYLLITSGDVASEFLLDLMV